MGVEHIKFTVAAAQAGDADAFRCLVEQHRSSVFGICYRLTNNPHDAEDLAHEAFIEAYIKLHTLREADKFAAWLRTLTLNLCRGWYRQRKRDLNTECEDLLPLAQVGNETAYRHLYVGLDQLSPAHRLALVLHYLEGLSYEETSSFLDVPVGTVMSRLHRARKNLKNQIEKLRETEETPMVNEDQFSEEVDAEIALLLKMFQQEPNAMTRLSVILKHTPERIGRLLSAPVDDSILGSLALLSPRLGASAMGVLLDLYFDAEPATRANALAVIVKLLANCQSECNGITRAFGVGLGDMPGFDAYVLLDQLILRNQQDHSTAELLIELLLVADDAPTGQLLSEVMLCLGEPADKLLMQRFRDIETREEIYRRSNWIVQTLRNRGTSFLTELTNTLSRESARTDLALSGMDKQLDKAWGFQFRSDKSTVPGARFICETLDPAIVSLVELDENAIQEAARQVCRFLEDDNTELRNTALRVLARLGRTGYVENLQAALKHPITSTRICAIQALAGLEDRRSADMIMTMARNGETSERIAAIAALGRLRINDARQLFIDLLDDEDVTIVKTTLVALSELSQDEASPYLKRFLSAPDKSLRRTASKAMYGGKDRKGQVDAPRITQAKPHFSGTRLEDPNARRVHHISADAALRMLPEIRNYTEREITERIALVCGDWAATRRKLIEHRLVSRSNGIYQFTELGSAVWRVEHYIMSHYLRGQVSA